MNRTALIFAIVLASGTASASTAWLRCSNAEATLIRRQTNYPNGQSLSVWSYKAATLNPVEQSSPRSAVEAFDEASRRSIENSESVVVGSDGVKRKKPVTEYSIKVTVSVVNHTPLDPVMRDVASVTENVICQMSVVE